MFTLIDILVYGTAAFLVVLGVTLVIAAVVDWIDERLS